MTKRILVVEDNPDNLDLMVYLLSAFGYQAASAVDGQTGLALALLDKPDLIVCDVHLPRMDGYEVVRQLKADPECCSIPTVAVTALAMVGDRDRVLAAGFDGYLTKPINPETFVRQIEGFLGSSRPQPARCDAAQTPATTATPSKPAAVLAVDNVKANLDLARSILEPFGYGVITASHPQEALERASQNPPDLILSDICMVEGNGYDFIKSVKADPRLAPIPFIFITSTMMQEEDRRRGLALGADRFLTRPIDSQQLLAEIQSCLHKV